MAFFPHCKGELTKNVNGKNVGNFFLSCAINEVNDGQAGKKPPLSSK